MNLERALRLRSVYGTLNLERKAIEHFEP